MTPLSRRVASTLLVAVLGVAGMAAAQAQDTVRLRVEADDVFVQDGQRWCRDPRGGGFAKVTVTRDRTGRFVYDCWVPRYRSRGGYGLTPWFDDTRYRPPARSVDCTSTGNCTVKYHTPYYDRRGYGAGHDRGYRRDASGRDDD